MKLSDIKAGQVYTYIRGRVGTYSTGELVRVISPEPHAFDRSAGHPVPAPGYKIGSRNGFDYSVGILIARARERTTDLSDPKWDGLTAESGRASGEIWLEAVRQQELHPADFKAELERQYQERIANQRRTSAERQERVARQYQAAQSISREVGQDVSLALVIKVDFAPEPLEAIANALAERSVQVRAIEALADSMERESPDGVDSHLARQLRTTLAEATGKTPAAS